MGAVAAVTAECEAVRRIVWQRSVSGRPGPEFRTGVKLAYPCGFICLVVRGRENARSDGAAAAASDADPRLAMRRPIHAALVV